eukprot:4853311-Pleurochrysis_carterae.AAC.1
MHAAIGSHTALDEHGARDTQCHDDEQTDSQCVGCIDGVQSDRAEQLDPAPFPAIQREEIVVTRQTSTALTGPKTVAPRTCSISPRITCHRSAERNSIHSFIALQHFGAPACHCGVLYADVRASSDLLFITASEHAASPGSTSMRQTS